MKKYHIACLFIMMVIVMNVALSPSIFASKEKYYNANTKTVTLKEDGDTIATIRLITPHLFYVNAGYTKIAEFEIDNKRELNNFIRGIDSYDLNQGKLKKTINYDIKMWSKTGMKTVNDYKEVCNAITENGTKSECTYEIIGSHEEDVYGFVDFDKSKINTKMRVGLFTNVKAGDKVEWIPNFNGFYVPEWAIYKTAVLTYIGGNSSRFLDSSGSYLRGQCLMANKNLTIISFSVNESNTAKNCYITNKCGYAGGDIIASGNITNLVCDFNSAGFGTGYASVSKGQNFSLAFNNFDGSAYGSLYNNSYFGENFSEVNITNIAWATTTVPATFYSPQLTDIMNMTTKEETNLTVDLSYPSDNYFSYRNFNLTFNCTTHSINLIKNVTLWFNDTGLTQVNNDIGWYNHTFSFSHNLTHTAKSLWNCFVCDVANQCIFADNNFTLNTVSYLENATFYVPLTTEGTTNLFSLNLTISSLDIFTNATFIYNNTRYATSISSLGGGNYQLYNNFQAPLVTSNVNNTFYWEIKLTSGISNTTMYNQTVTNLNIDNCSSFTDILYNFSLVDEKDQYMLKYPIFNGSTNIQIDMQLSSLSNQSVLSFNSTSINNGSLKVCLQGGLPTTDAYYVNAVVRYTAEGFESEFYYIQNSIINNNTKYNNITLFDLNSTQSTKYKIIYSNKDFVAVPDVVVWIQRKYIGEGVYKIVEAPITNYFGTTYAHLDDNGVDYNILMTQNGRILSTFPIRTTKCQDILTSTCDLNLNDYYSVSSFNNFECNLGLCTNIVFNKTSNIISSSFFTDDGTNANILLNVTGNNNYNNMSLCTGVAFSSSGNVFCTLPATTQNISFTACVYKNGVQTDCKVFTKPIDTKSIFSYDGYIIMILLLITMPFMFLSSIPAFLVSIILTLILGSLLLLYNGGTGLGTGGFLISLIVVVIAIIWKITNRRIIAG